MFTEQQRLTLKTYILANYPDKASGPGTDYQFIAEAVNAAAAPAFYAWRGIVSSEELVSACLIGGTQLDGLTAGKRDALLWAIDRSLNFKVASTRAAIDDFCGSQATLKSALQAVQRRTCSVLEKMFAVGTGSYAAPANVVIEGAISIGDIGAVLA